MNTVKLERINNNLLRELSYILANDVADHNLKYVTVTAVKTSNDLSYAKVYITLLNEEYKNDTLKSLKSAKGYIKKEKSEKDERELIISLTKEGINLKEEAKNVPPLIAKKVKLSQEEAKTLYTLLYKLLEGFENE